MCYAFVTGSTGGLGKEFCVELAKRNYNLFLTGRSKQKLEELKSYLFTINKDIKIDCFSCDLTIEDSRNLMFQYVLERNYKFCSLFNVAGVDTQMSFNCYTQSKLVFQARVNFEATLSVTKFVLENKYNNLKILTVGSVCGLVPMPYFAEYSATKKALEFFFKALRVENKKDKISILMPGSMPTREDIIKDIEKQGLNAKLSLKSPSLVVKVALKGLEKNKKVIIPGFFNKLYYIYTKIMPESIQMAIIKNKFSKKTKDAF